MWGKEEFGFVLLLFTVVGGDPTINSSEDVRQISRLLVAKMDNFEKRMELDIKIAKYELRREIRRNSRSKEESKTDKTILFEVRSLRMDVMMLSNTVGEFHNHIQNIGENRNSGLDERLLSLERDISHTKQVVENIARILNNVSADERNATQDGIVARTNTTETYTDIMKPLKLVEGHARKAAWDGLKVMWGTDPSTAFKSVPRTRREADALDWVNMTPDLGCNDHPRFKGERYWKDNDPNLILIYNAVGYIAGIQAGIPGNHTDDTTKYPYAELINRPFVLDDGYYFTTAYFVNPASLCEEVVDSPIHGTGSGLWFQNGTDPVSDSVEIPHQQTDLESTMWVQGPCFKTMGVHYWYNISKDMSCNDFFPAFLLYNGGILNAFGWAFGMNVNSTVWMEHPKARIYPVFMNPVPDCLYTAGNLSTQHIYLTNNITANTC